MCCVILDFKEVEIPFMMKGAISFFAFSIFLFGCAAPITYQSPPPLPPSQVVVQPDFTLSDIFSHEKEWIGIEGSEAVPEVDR